MAKIIQKFAHLNNEYNIANTTTTPSGNVDADDVVYSNTTSGLTATNVQDAIDELSRTPGTSYTAGDGISINNDEISVNASTADYDNTTSLLTATNIQSAIDEIDSNVDDVVSDVSTIQGDITTIQGDITDIKNIIEATTMPAASATNEGDIVQYKGATTSSYTQGYFYKSVSDGQDPATYSWEQIDVQPSVNNLSDLNDVDVSSLEDGQLMRYNATSHKRENFSLEAGEGIVLGDIYDHTQGPCQIDEHLPNVVEIEILVNALKKLVSQGENLTDLLGNVLHIPPCGWINENGILEEQGDSYAFRGTENHINSNISGAVYAYLYYPNTNIHDRRLFQKTNALPVRPFLYAANNRSNFTLIKGSLNNAYIGYTNYSGTITSYVSIVVGYNGFEVTLAPQNVGATSIYNGGDSLTEQNMGYMFQFGNDFGFNSTSDISESDKIYGRVDVSDYLISGYNNSKFVISDENYWTQDGKDGLWRKQLIKSNKINIALPLASYVGQNTSQVLLHTEDYCWVQTTY